MSKNLPKNPNRFKALPYLTGIHGQARALRKRFFRDKTALFFTFLFPLIFLFIFGSIFNNKTLSFKIGLINHSSSPLAQDFERRITSETSIFKVTKITDLTSAQEDLKRSILDGIIELPADFGTIKNSTPAPSSPIQDLLKHPETIAGFPKPTPSDNPKNPSQPTATPTGTIRILHAKGSEEAGSTLAAIFTQISASINRSLGHPEAPIQVEKSPVGDAALSQFDYTFTGLLAFSLISMGIFGLSNALPAEKERGVYRRLRASPFTKGQLIISTALVYTGITIISLATMLIVGLLVFQFKMRGSWLLFSLFATLGAIMMNGIGLLVGGWAKNEKQSAPISNLISMPMMFLSGTFFPTFLFPEWLQSVGKIVPVTPVVDSIRLIMTENASFSSLLPQFTLMSLWIFIIYFLAIRLFRWE